MMFFKYLQGLYEYYIITDNDYSKHSPIKMSNKQAWTEHLSTEKLFTKSDNPLTAATPIEEVSGKNCIL